MIGIGRVPGVEFRARGFGATRMLKFFKDLFKPKVRRTRVDVTKRFDLIGRVGQGSMSKVWRARDVMTGRQVAVKVLDREKTLKFEARFQGLKKPTEGEIALQLKHPNIVRTFEIGWTIDDEQFLVMEYVEGSSLSFFIEMQNEVMKSHRLAFAIELGDGIEFFHSRKWIHRDICPRNVLITEDHHVKLIDFGLVVPNEPEFRRPGNRTGTANYMAPELIKRQPTDERIDIFSYAVTCYEMWTRKHPWPEGNSLDAVIQHINSPPEDIRHFVPDLDEEIAETIMRGLCANPHDRWSHVRQMTDRYRAASKRLSIPLSPPPAPSE